MNRLGVLKPVWDFLTSEKVQNLSVALAVLIGGAWSLYTYRVSEERSADARKPVVKAAFSRLERVHGNSGHDWLAVNVILENAGGSSIILQFDQEPTLTVVPVEWGTNGLGLNAPIEEMLSSTGRVADFHGGLAAFESLLVAAQRKGNLEAHTEIVRFLNEANSGTDDFPGLVQTLMSDEGVSGSEYLAHLRGLYAMRPSNTLSLQPKSQATVSYLVRLGSHEVYYVKFAVETRAEVSEGTKIRGAEISADGKWYITVSDFSLKLE